MVIGVYGDTAFEVSGEKVMTFEGLKRAVKKRYAEHKIMGGKPKLENVGDELTELTFTVELRSSLGVNVKAEIEKLESICKQGIADYLVIGSENYGLYVIESVESKMERWLGEYVIEAKLEMKLKEYNEVGDY